MEDAFAYSCLIRHVLSLSLSLTIITCLALVVSCMNSASRSLHPFPHYHRRTAALSPKPAEGAKMCVVLSRAEQEQLIEKLQVFKIKGRDKRGRKVLRIVGKFFPARFLSTEVVNEYLEEKIYPRLSRKRFSVVYVHSEVQRSDNFPGFLALRSMYDSIPAQVMDNLETVHFVQPGLQARLFFATFGRLLFTGGLYGKLNYVSRLDLLWDHVRRSEIEIPEFAQEHDEDLEYRPMMDYGLESDHARVHGALATDASVSIYSMRCIS
ncbi:ganglioside-induced differentiation-associated protein 2 [Rhodamnia argentea]|uniref:Ganglioside-induced differentiation-associated protein 2 n=1 Tax=Rhodamnia argentea TaxID=178133 RepID=A0A8B8PM07_9MYRT|nr:ganglioside-induced differentiation-associated protein 2 [Rhodamnia argentea]